MTESTLESRRSTGRPFFMPLGRGCELHGAARAAGTEDSVFIKQTVLLDGTSRRYGGLKQRYTWFIDIYIQYMIFVKRTRPSLSPRGTRIPRLLSNHWILWNCDGFPRCSQF